MNLSNKAAAINDQIDSRAESDHQFLSFRLGDEEYGVEILRVREIIGIIDITSLPQTPEYVKGVINLRGKIIPVIELRRKFGLPSIEFDEATCIIVVEVMVGEDQFQVGIIVDTVSEVLPIPPEDIEPAPRFGDSLNTEVIQGMGKTRDRVVILLDLDRVLTGAAGELHATLGGDAAEREAA